MFKTVKVTTSKGYSWTSPVSIKRSDEAIEKFFVGEFFEIEETGEMVMVLKVEECNALGKLLKPNKKFIILQ